MKLNIKDRPGAILKDTMRTYFEGAIRDTEKLSATPIGAININGEFSHYADNETDTMWFGFAMGMRYSERLEKAKLLAANEVTPRDQMTKSLQNQ